MNPPRKPANDDKQKFNLDVVFDFDFGEDGAREALEEKFGPAAVYNLTAIALDARQPAGARVKASEILMKAAGIGASSGEGGKDLHEMTPEELRREIAQLEAARASMQRALVGQAKQIDVLGVADDDANVFD